MQKLNAGITLPGEGDSGTVWNIVGQVYFLKGHCDSSFGLEMHGTPGTFVPTHIHPAQDEFIVLLEGRMDVTLGGQSHGLHPAGMARMPIGMPHAFANAGDRPVKALFWDSPARQPHEMFIRIHNLTDPAEAVRISANGEVGCLPPPA